MARQRTPLERRYVAQRASAEKLVAAAHGDEVIEVMCSFSDLDCVADVKLKSGWIRYLLIEGGDDEDNDTIRRIG